MQEPELKEVLTVMEVAKLLRLTRQSIYILCHSGKLPHFRVGSKLRFSRAEIEAMMKPVPSTKGQTT